MFWYLLQHDKFNSKSNIFYWSRNEGYRYSSWTSKGCWNETVRDRLLTAALRGYSPYEMKRMSKKHNYRMPSSAALKNKWEGRREELQRHTLYNCAHQMNHFHKLSTNNSWAIKNKIFIELSGNIHPTNHKIDANFQAYWNICCARRNYLRYSLWKSNSSSSISMVFELKLPADW